MSALAGVLGFPVAHSRSPAMMNAAFAELDLDWRYVHLPVSPGLFERTVRALPASGYRGANVTIPHKLAARDLADELSDAARAIGAVNTLSFAAGGRIAGDNTDAAGLLDALGERPSPATALVLGAGGTGRAAAWALRRAGVGVTVWNRTPERAAELAAELGVGRAGERPPGPVELLVNATSVGLDPGDAVEALPLPECETVVDFVYGGEHVPAVSRWATEHEIRLVDGLELLVRQGAHSFSLWTGREAPLEVMRRAAGRRPV